MYQGMASISPDLSRGIGVCRLSNEMARFWIKGTDTDDSVTEILLASIFDSKNTCKIYELTISKYKDGIEFWM